MNMENSMENSYDFIINDEDEVMLLLYAEDSEPKNATIEIDVENMSAILHRNDEDSIMLESIPEDVLDSLQDADTLLVCELSHNQSESDNEDDDETQIVYAYEADISM